MFDLLTIIFDYFIYIFSCFDQDRDIKRSHKTVQIIVELSNNPGHQ